jgi:HAD superfamily hydrolase (TIGR01549 family)
MKNVIFDLDLTLVDSTIAEEELKKRNWTRVDFFMPDFVLYKGLYDVFKYIRNFNIQVCIVSTAPKPYIEKVVRQFNIPCNFIVGYYDAKPIKPHPSPMLRALEHLQSSKVDVVSFGDQVIDLESSHRAGIYSIGCTWGSKETDLLRNSAYTNYIIDHPREIIDFIIE